MPPDGDLARRVALDFVERSRRMLAPYLLQPSRFEAELAPKVGTHGEDNDAYRVDLVVDDLLTTVLEEHGIEGRVFSEESGWRRTGTRDDYRIICDPFDNSFLSTRSFRDSAVTLSVADHSGQFLCCALGDLATTVVYLADETGPWILEPGSNGEGRRPATTSSVTTLEDAFVIMPAMLRPGREHVLAAGALVSAPRHLLTLDGVVLLGRLAAGYVDAYVDAVVGQQLYEMPCLELVVRAGGIVTDKEGKPFDYGQLVRELERDPDARMTVVAASTHELHDEILSALG